MVAVVTWVGRECDTVSCLKAHNVLRLPALDARLGSPNTTDGVTPEESVRGSPHRVSSSSVERLYHAYVDPRFGIPGVMKNGDVPGSVLNSWLSRFNEADRT